MAVLLNPLDNDSAQLDVDRNSTYVRLLQGNLNYFSVLLNETQGTGPDSETVTASSVMLTENGRLLLPGIDYVFAYSVNSREIRLTHCLDSGGETASTKLLSTISQASALMRPPERKSWTGSHSRFNQAMARR